MSEDKIDEIFRNHFNDSENISSEIRWNVDDSWKRFDRKHNKKIVGRNFWLAVASIALLIGTALFYYTNIKPKTDCFTSNADTAVKELLLKGGYKCYLSEDSKIQFCYSKNTAIADTLYLTGQTYIETPASRTLVVIAKNTYSYCKNAKVNIKSMPNEKTTVISPLSGNVMSKCLESGFPIMEVEPNERCVVYEDGIFASKEPNTDPNFLAWKTGTLTFDNTPLAYAVKAIEDYYRVSIEVQSNEIKYCSFSSKFNNSELNTVLQSIQKSFHAKTNITENNIVVEGGECR